MLEFELVLPCYNEEKNLVQLVRRCVEAARSENLTPQAFQLVLVENKSRDGSLKLMQDLKKGENGPWFRIVRVEENIGYGNGVWQGLKSTSAPIVAWSHADLQCNPAYPIQAWRKLKESQDPLLLIKGKRYGRNWKDQFVSRVFELMARLILGFKCGELNAQPKVFSRKLLDQIAHPPANFAFDLYVLYRAQKAGYHFNTILVEFPPRIHGISNWAGTFLGRYKTILGMIRYMWQLAQTEGRL